jgi:hypothetical protein
VTCARSRLGEFTAVIDLRPFTHIPSNVLVILVPLAVLVLLLRFSISQLDVPTRQSCTTARSILTSDRRRPACQV